MELAVLKDDSFDCLELDRGVRAEVTLTPRSIRCCVQLIHGSVIYSNGSCCMDLTSRRKGIKPTDLPFHAALAVDDASPGTAFCILYRDVYAKRKLLRSCSQLIFVASAMVLSVVSLAEYTATRAANIIHADATARESIAAFTIGSSLIGMLRAMVKQSRRANR